MANEMWEDLAEKAFSRWAKNYVQRMPQISLPKPLHPSNDFLADIETFDGPGPWDRTLVELEMEKPGATNEKLLIFSSNDYLGLSSHPAVRNAVAKAAMEYGMGPRASSMICGHTNYHRQLEATLAKMTKKEDCVICPSGFAANNAFISALGSIASILATDTKPSRAEKIAIFSDALNHASIVDGLRLVERHNEAEVFVYKHNDMNHLNFLLSSCTNERKVVFTDSMEGYFAPMLELVELRKKHGFLFVIDDAHGTLVCGKNGGGIAEAYGIEEHIDICVGTMSKAMGCVGGFITCSKSWKGLIQTRGRPFIFTTTIPVPIVVGTLAAIEVAKKEEWRRKMVWSHVEYFSSLTKIHIASPIVSLVVGTEEATLHASRQLLEKGFHVTPIRPPAVAPNACRLRVTLAAAHTRDDVKRLVLALSHCIKLPSFDRESNRMSSRI